MSASTRVSSIKNLIRDLWGAIRVLLSKLMLCSSCKEALSPTLSIYSSIALIPMCLIHSFLLSLNAW